MPFRTDFKATGVATILYNLDQLRGKQLQKTTAQVIQDAGKQILVPAIAQATPGDGHGHSGGKDPNPTKGKLKDRRKITGRRVRLHAGELVAVSFKPRQWWFHFVAGGTKAHVIEARVPGASTRASSSIVRVINRHGDSRRALFFNGVFAAQVHHPGAKPNDYVNRAAQRKGPELAAALSTALQKKLKEH